jgi:hypothetical protein
VWIGLGVRPMYTAIRQYLPKALSSKVEKMIPKTRLTKKQISRIELLGSNIGLEKEDIIAAVDGPIPVSGVAGRSRFILLANIIVVTVVVIAAVLLVWTVVDPETSPIRTYAPGSLYCTIKPEDFANAQ